MKKARGWFFMAISAATLLCCSACNQPEAPANSEQPVDVTQPESNISEVTDTSADQQDAVSTGDSDEPSVSTDLTDAKNASTSEAGESAEQIISTAANQDAETKATSAAIQNEPSPSGSVKAYPAGDISKYPKYIEKLLSVDYGSYAMDYLGYALCDINGDNTPELFIAWMPGYREDDSYIEEIYTINNGKLNRIKDRTCVMTTKGYISKGSLECMGDDYKEMTMCHYDGGTKLTEWDTFAINFDLDNFPAGNLYKIKNKYGTRKVSKKEFDSALDSYGADYELSLTSIGDYQLSQIKTKTGSVNSKFGNDLSKYPLYNDTIRNNIDADNYYRDGWNLNDVKYLLCDINSDSTPEMFILTDRDGIIDLYTIKNQKVISLWEGYGRGQMGSCSLLLYKTGYLCEAAYGFGGQGETYYKYTGGSSLTEIESITIVDETYTWSQPGKNDCTINEKIYDKISASYGELVDFG